MLPDDFYLLKPHTVGYLNSFMAEYPLSSHESVESRSAPQGIPDASSQSSSLASVTAAAAACATAPPTRCVKPAKQPFKIIFSQADLPLWQHPPPTAWSDIQKAALRAFVTLEWLSCPDVKLKVTQQAKLKGMTFHKFTAVRFELIKFAHGLLVGHIMDPKLDMKQIFR